MHQTIRCIGEFVPCLLTLKKSDRLCAKYPQFCHPAKSTNPLISMGKPSYVHTSVLSMEKILSNSFSAAKSSRRERQERMCLTPWITIYLVTICLGKTLLGYVLCTDGAPSIVRPVKGFVSLVKKVNPQILAPCTVKSS